MKTSLKNKVVLITGASAGFGKTMAETFAKEGCNLALGARRVERLKEIQTELTDKYGIQILTAPLDVTDLKSTQAFMAEVKKKFQKIDILVNNAGLAKGRDPIADTKEEDMIATIETNVLGVLRVTRETLQQLIPQNHPALIINMGSIAGFYTYEGGGAYAASKHSIRAISQILRLELLGKPIRITEIDPGMAETEFSEVRFSGDKQKAKDVYKGMRPLVAQDIADCALFAATMPMHVNIDQIVINSIDQAQLKIHRT